MIDAHDYAGQWIALDKNQNIVGSGKSPETVRDQLKIKYEATTEQPLTIAWVPPYPPYLLLPEWPLQLLKPLFKNQDVWLAGGAVRDLLLQRPMHDWDFTVAGKAMSLTRKIANALHGAYVTLDADHDTARAVVKDPATDQPITLDFAALRGQTIEEDLCLRDFTINAMALTLEGELIDPTGGREDLKTGIVRVTNAQAFKQDPARLLRALRVAGELQLEIETQTCTMIRAQKADITEVSAERIQAELLRILALDETAPTLTHAEKLGLLAEVLPEVSTLQTVEQSWPHYCTDALTHTLNTVTATGALINILKEESAPLDLPTPDWSWETAKKVLLPFKAPLDTYLAVPLAADMPRKAMLKWGALLHDIGKAHTRTVDQDQRVHFYGHPEKGVELAKRRLANLRFPNQACDFVATLVGAHMRLIGLGKEPLSRRTIYRFYRDTGEAGIGVVLLALADALAVWGPQLERERWQRLLTTAETLLQAYFEHQKEVVAPSLLLNGHELIAMGIEPGPGMGHLLAKLQEAQAAGEVQTKDEAATFIHTMLKADGIDKGPTK